MKVTEIDKNQEEIELKFDRYKLLSEQILSKSDQMKRENCEKKSLMEQEIRSIK